VYCRRDTRLRTVNRSSTPCHTTLNDTVPGVVGLGSTDKALVIVPKSVIGTSVASSDATPCRRFTWTPAGGMAVVQNRPSD